MRLKSLDEALDLRHSADPSPQRSSAYEALLAVSQRIRSRYRRPSDYDVLTPGERLLFRVWTVLNSEVDNGGIDQFLRNGSGDDAEAIREDLRRIGATRTAAVLDEVASWFADGVIPNDSDARFDRLVEVEEEQGEEAFEQLEHEMTLAYRAAQDELYDRLLDFIEQHRSDFEQPQV